MVLIAVGSVPAKSKPVGVRISTGERHGFGASALLSTGRHPCKGEPKV